MYCPRVLKNEVSIRDVIPGILGPVVTIAVAGDDICLRLLEAYKSREGRRTSILRERGRSRLVTVTSRDSSTSVGMTESTWLRRLLVNLQSRSPRCLNPIGTE
jgi:hypothetical protein